jgi:hypothetical protein
MRARRTSWAGAVLAALAAAPAGAQDLPKPESILAFRPMVGGVDYDIPAKDEVAGCKTEFVTNPADPKQKIGFALRDAQGKLLRRFVDTNLKVSKRDKEPAETTHMDRWSYYRDGFEVYRESDLDEDGVLDEVRWMNTGGTRVGRVKPEVVQGRPVYRVAQWERISAEEASKVLVQALIAGDLPMLESVMLTPEDIKALGLPDELAQRATASAAGRRDAMLALRKQLKGWDAETTWGRFDGMMPHVIPADAAPGLSKDVYLYENAVVFVNPSARNTNAAEASLAYLHVPEVIRVGEAWKFLDLPKAVDPSNPVVADLGSASLRSAIYRADAGVGPDVVGPNIPPELLDKLAKLDEAMPGPDAGDKALAEWHLKRIAALKEIIAAIPDEAQKLNFYKLVVHDLAEAYRTGLYPQGAQVFDDLIAQGGKIGSFASYRKILAEFDIAAAEEGADYQKVQAETVAKLEKFLADHAQADEVPDVLFQIATVHEFNGDAEKAKQYWTRLARQYDDTPPGHKAAGALKRLDSEGKPLVVAGTALDGKSASTADFAGKTVAVLYFMTITEPDRREIEDLVRLQEKYRDKGFAVLGAGLDPDRATLDAFLKDTPLPWPILFEDGGLDSRLANELGIVSTPTIVLLDPQGKVISHKIRKASEVEKYLEKPLASDAVGLNLKQP